MRRLFALVALALFASVAVGGEVADAKSRKVKPDLRRCPVLEPLPEGDLARTVPIEIPKAIQKSVLVSRERLAMAATDGSMICIDVRLRGEVTNLAMSPEGRFFTFDWQGYEADGHVIVDRSGSGQVVDTGSPPSISPSRQRIAAVHQSEAAFSELQGLGVWQINQTGMAPVALVSNIPEMADWRIDVWKLEDCIDLSAVPFSRMPDNRAALANVQRDRYMARPYGQTWRLTRTTLGCSAG